MIGLAACDGGVDETVPNTLADTETADTSAADEADARSFVDEVFGAYSSDGVPGHLSDPAPVFAPDLAGRIATLNAEATATGSVPDGLGADPICDCQDWEELSYDITALTIDANRAEVELDLTNFGETVQRSITLAKTRSGWRIYDIDDGFRASIMGGE